MGIEDILGSQVCPFVFYLIPEESSNIGDTFLQGQAGWREAVSPHDRWLQTILNNVVYYLNEAPDPTQNESDYCLPCEDDKATLL